YQLRGFVQRRQKGRYEEATLTLEHSIDLDPRNFLTLNQIAAYNYRRLGRFADAKSAWERLLAIRPDAVTAQLGRDGGLRLEARPATLATTVRFNSSRKSCSVTQHRRYLDPLRIG